MRRATRGLSKGDSLETNVKAIELKDLWRRYKTDGSDKAREQLVVAYSPLVKYVAGRMSSGLPAHVEEADLISYGLLGLINAIERFDLTREIKFETYAITRIKGAIIDELRALDTIHDENAPDPEALLAQSELKDRLADAIAALPEREKLVIALYYYENLTLREIGEVLGVTESRISQLHTKAVLRLKSRLQPENLRD